jgi:hypothetical protein
MRLGRALAVVAGAILVLISRPAGVTAAAEEADRPAELKALDRWVGEWEMEVSVKPAAWLPQGSRSTFKASTRWTLNGRVLQCDANGEGTAGERKFKDAFTWIITYDPGARTYVSTVFWSNVPGNWGGGMRATATWDERAGTLTTRAVDADSGVTSAGVTTWVDADTHEFVSTAKDRNGQVLMEMTGKAKRKK